MRNVKRIALGTVAAIAAALMVAPAANAATATALILSSNTIVGGTTLTATASYTATTPNDEVQLVIPLALEPFVTVTSVSSTGADPCGVGSGDIAYCGWTGATVGANLTMTVVFDVAPATPLGNYSLTAYSVGPGTPLTQTVTVVDAPPVLNPIGNVSVAENATSDVMLTATDQNGDAVSFLGVSLPSFATLTDNSNGTATLRLTPGFADAGAYSATVAAFNGGGNDPETFTITVTNTDRPPVLDTIGAQSVAEGGVLDVTITGSDPDGDAVSFLDVTLPPFATLTDNGNGTATLRLTPGFADAGSYSATIAAFNGGGNDPETFTITVTGTNQAPVLAAIGNQTVAEGATLVIPVSATDQDGGPLQFLPSGLPAFASFLDNNDGTGTLTLNPSFTDAGTYDITMLVTDGFLDDTEVFTVTVSEVNRAPVLSVIGDQTVAEGGTLVIPVSATDPDGDPLQFLPSGLPGYATFVDNNDGTGTLTLNPTAGDVGDIADITMLVTDGFLDATEIFTVTIVDPTSPTVVVPTDITIEATGPSGTAVPFTASATDLLDGALTPSCTPPAGSVFPLGTTTVTCTATDSDGNSGSSSFSVTVQDTTAPVITGEGGNAPSTIEVGNAPTTGLVVAFATSATDIVDGNVTTGCTPASGTVFPIGTTTVTCTATDAAGNTATVGFNVVLTAAPAVPSGSGGGKPGTTIEDLPATGGAVPWVAGTIGTLLLAFGGVMLTMRRRVNTHAH